MCSFNVIMFCVSVLVLMGPGTVLEQHVLPLHPAWSLSSSVLAAPDAVSHPSGCVIMRMTVEMVQMRSAPLPVPQGSSAAPVVPVCPWSSAVMAILIVLTSQMRTFVPLSQKCQSVQLASSSVQTDAACLLLKCVTEDWTVDLLMTQMKKVSGSSLRTLWHEQLY